MIGVPISADTAGVQAHLNDQASSKELTAEYKEKKKLAKRIIKAVQASLEDAMRKESEICQKPFEKELRDLDLLLENSLLSRRDSSAGSVVGDVSDVEMDEPKISVRRGSHSKSRRGSEVLPKGELSAGGDGVSPGDIGAISVIRHSKSQHGNNGGEPGPAQENNIEPSPIMHSATHQHPTPEASTTTTSMLTDAKPNNRKPNGAAHDTTSYQTSGAIQHIEPPTPPLSSGGDLQPLSNGGIPWYMDPFDPEGTTVQEERWTGRELVRGMSEELSDMDEEELSGLVDGDMVDNAQYSGAATLNPDAAVVAASRRKAAAKRKRWRGYR